MGGLRRALRGSCAQEDEEQQSGLSYSSRTLSYRHLHICSVPLIHHVVSSMHCHLALTLLAPAAAEQALLVLLLARAPAPELLPALDLALDIALGAVPVAPERTERARRLDEPDLRAQQSVSRQLSLELGDKGRRDVKGARTSRRARCARPGAPRGTRGGRRARD